ncbi:MAG: hypothetical protein Q9224_006180 [Gallowayella concinna]
MSGKVELKIQNDLTRQLNWGDPRRGPIYDTLLTLNKKSLSLIQMSRLCNDNSTVLQDGQRLQNLTWRMLSLNILSCSTTPKQKSIETRLTKFLDKIFSGMNLFETEGFPTVNILEQPLRPCHNNHDKILQNVSPILYPPIIIEYFSLIQKFKSAESCCKQFEILCSHSNRRRIEAGNGDITKAFRTMLKLQEDCVEYLEGLKKEIHILRKECILAGHSTYEIDAIMTTEWPSDNGLGTHLGRPVKPQNYQNILEIRKHTQDWSLLNGWTDTRDGINRWILHSLRADEAQARLHRSMLAEPDIGDEAWARLVLKYWTLDEAATGTELWTSLSVGAVDSREFSKMESTEFYSCLESVAVSNEHELCDMSHEDSMEAVCNM